MRKLSGSISKTMIFGVVYLLFAVFAVIAGVVGYDQFAPSAELVAMTEAIVALIAAAVAMWLRHKTSEPMA